MFSIDNGKLFQLLLLILAEEAHSMVAESLTYVKIMTWSYPEDEINIIFQLLINCDSQ